MASDVSRRGFLEVAGTVVAAGAIASVGTANAAEQAAVGKLKIVGVCCSPRKGKTTAAAMQMCLDAAKSTSPEVEIELIELAGLKIPGGVAAGVPLEPGEKDDFPALAEKLGNPAVAGIIVGTPVYFGNMSSLCKAFIDRCMIFRKNNFVLSDKVGGVLAVGAARNGGQELTTQSVLAAMLCQEMIVVGDGKPSAHIGGTLVNDGKDSISGDEFGTATARNLGRRVAEVALLVKRAR
ncbi:MAG TPA: flavodoxin family protein [Phycisphaerae bacterium]|nr:flavodoxin family protein [Phycisphaerae bacterium]HRY71168.1 flavodoxin family protein [Phycisphaerae bacterium]HSA29890.1 flavodoxin family protein [Phycisphaerae bacterium]